MKILPLRSVLSVFVAFFMLETLFAAPTSWKTEAELTQALQTPVSLVWDGTPIRETLERFSENQRVAIRLDRRVNPAFLISGSFQNAAIPQILHESLQNETLLSKNLAFTEVGNLLYAGPRDWTMRVRTVVERKEYDAKKQLSNAAQKKWFTPCPLAWDRAAQPKEILENLAQKQGLKLDGLKNVPHDVWPAGSLPPMTPIEICVLILGEFNLTLEFSPSGASVAELTPQDGVRSVIYAVKKVPEEKLAALRNVFPDMKTVTKLDKIQITVPVEAHQFLRDSESKTFPVGTLAFLLGAASTDASGRTPTGVDRSLQRFSGKVANQMFLPVLKQFCDMQGYTLEMDADALVSSGIALDALISVEFKDATADEVIQSIAAAGKCTVEIQKNKVILKQNPESAP